MFILEHSIYSVISPEGCAAILWKDQAMKETAAEAMKITAPDLLQFGIVCIAGSQVSSAQYTFC